MFLTIVYTALSDEEHFSFQVPLHREHPNFANCVVLLFSAILSWGSHCSHADVKNKELFSLYNPLHIEYQKLAYCDAVWCYFGFTGLDQKTTH